jgi:precorrin-6B methylase 2
MEQVTDWVQLWRELVERQSHSWEEKLPTAGAETGRPGGAEPRPSTRRRWAKPDSNRDAIVAQLLDSPDSTLLDIGAGTGSWAILLSPHARKITAVDSSPAMIEAMGENLTSQGIHNVEIVRGTWPDVEVEPHDFSLCSHGMYACPDLPAFVRKMVQATRRRCFLILRASTPDGVMAEAAQHVWGHPYDSPNFQVAYNVLMQMGIFANVLMSDSGLWAPWTSASVEEALAEVKRRLGLGPVDEHDEFLNDLVRRRLTRVDGVYVWPRSVRSALVYWNVT